VRRRRAVFRGGRRRGLPLPEAALRDRYASRSPDPAAGLSPLIEVSTPSPLAQSSERTGARLTLRLSVTAVVVLGLFSTLLVRLWSLQVIQGPQLNAAARATITRTIALEAPRGEILARNGLVLAGSVAKEEVTIDSETVATYPSDLSNLGSLLGVAPSTIAAAVKDAYGTPYSPVPVPTGPGGVTSEELAYIEDHPKLFPGVTVGLTYERTYPEGALASQLLGYVSEPHPETETGASGIEAAYNTALRGSSGSEQVQVDPFGNLVSAGKVLEPVAGDNVVLNLDPGLQQVAATALSGDVATLRAGAPGVPPEPAPYAAAVVLSTDGKVLASVSYPGYNNNLWVPYITTKNYDALLNAPGEPLNNYVVSAKQPPGSVFKLATATAALDDGLISPYQIIDDTGSFTLGNQTYHDSADERPGPVDMSSALAQSSDVYFYTLGADFWADHSRYGPTPIQNAAHAYGLGIAPKIDLPADEVAAGQIDSAALRQSLHRFNAHAYPYNTYFGGDNVDLAIGQGETLVTPLEVADAYATFANGGTLYAPEIAAAYVAPNGKLARLIAPKVVGHVSLPQSTYQPMLAGFQGAVQGSLGTAHGAFAGFDLSNWNLQGKTGTASVSINDTTPPTSWFVGFGGPGSSHRYVVAVMVSEGGFGANAAAPVARKIFDYLQQEGVAPLGVPPATPAH